MSAFDLDPLNALPELSPPPELESSVLELSFAALDKAVESSEHTAPDRSCSGFETFVQGALVAAYAVYAVHMAIGMLDRVLPF